MAKAIRSSRMRACIEAGEPLVSFKVNVPHPMLIEILGLNGVGCFWLDCEHFPMGLETMSSLIQACRGVDADAMVRVPNGAYHLAGQMLDCGANAILYPQCDTAEDAAALVKATRFAPIGKRGLDAGMTAAGYGILSSAEYIQKQNQDPVIIVQIESPEALANVDDIAAVPGIDMLFFGPGDFSANLGRPGDMRHPDVQDALAKVAATADRHGLAWGTPGISPDITRELLAMGALLVNSSSDTTILRQQVTGLLADYRALGIQH